MNRSRAIRSLTFALALALALGAAGCALGKPRLRDRSAVVMDFTVGALRPEDGDKRELARSLADMLSANLINYPRFQTIERQNVVTLVARRGPGMGWREAGARLGADYVIAGAVARFDNNFVVNTRILSVETGEVIKGSSETRYCNRVEDLYPVLQALARVTAWHLASLDEIHDARIEGRVPNLTPAPAQPADGTEATP